MESRSVIRSENTDAVTAGRPVHAPDLIASDEAYEVVDGTILEWPNMGTYPIQIASNLHEYLAPFVRRQALGRSIVENQFQITPTRQRRPDLAFVSFARWPKKRRQPDGIWHVIPDLAVEVVSKSDEAWDVMEKIREYFDAGIATVWLVYPNLAIIHVYSAFDRIEVVTRAGTLDGGAVVPGFRLPLVEVFEEETEPEVESPAEPNPAS